MAVIGTVLWVLAFCFGGLVGLLSKYFSIQDFKRGDAQVFFRLRTKQALKDFIFETIAVLCLLLPKTEKELLVTPLAAHLCPAVTEIIIQ